MYTIYINYLNQKKYSKCLVLTKPTANFSPWLIRGYNFTLFELSPDYESTPNSTGQWQNFFKKQLCASVIQHILN